MRGLHHHALGLLGIYGIIPARAGFTSEIVIHVAEKTDHPRACGVYTSSRRRMAVGHGSSPRVRGLRGRGFAVSEQIGIIPARAGFTAGAAI